jgi:hypothetical protein
VGLNLENSINDIKTSIDKLTIMMENIIKKWKQY